MSCQADSPPNRTISVFPPVQLIFSLQHLSCLSALNACLSLCKKFLKKDGRRHIRCDHEISSAIGWARRNPIRILDVVVREQVDQDELDGYVRQEPPRARVGPTAPIEPVVRGRGKLKLAGIEVLALVGPAIRVEGIRIRPMCVPIHAVLQRGEVDGYPSREGQAILEGVWYDHSPLHGGLREGMHPMCFPHRAVKESQLAQGMPRPYLLALQFNLLGTAYLLLDVRQSIRVCWQVEKH